jgi:hypothetical protein
MADPSFGWCNFSGSHQRRNAERSSDSARVMVALWRGVALGNEGASIFEV